MSPRAWWAERSAREQRLLALAALAVIAGGWIAGVVRPLQHRYHNLETAVAVQRTQWAQMQADAAVIRQLRPHATPADADAGTQSPLLAAQQTVRELALEPFVGAAQSQGDTAVRLAFHDLPYESLLRWLDLLPAHRLRVRALSLTPAATQGNCQVQITLERAPS